MTSSVAFCKTTQEEKKGLETKLITVSPVCPEQGTAGGLCQELYRDLRRLIKLLRGKFLALIL